MILNIINDTKLKIKKSKKTFIFLVLFLMLAVSLSASFSEINKVISDAKEKNINDINVMDVSIYTDNYFTSSNKEEIKNIKGVKGVFLAKELSVKVKTSKISKNAKITNLIKDRNKINNDYINRITLIKGKYPNAINEVLVDYNFYKENNLSLNELITLKTKNSSDLRAKKLKIVGVVKSALKNNNFLYVYENEFGYNYYNKLYLTLNKNNDIKKIVSEITNIYINNDLANNNKDNLKITYKSKSKCNAFDNVRKKTNKIISIYSFIFLFITVILIIYDIGNIISKDKKEISILKKLGYSNIYIKTKYILYISCINVLGTTFGIFFKNVITNLVKKIYNSYYYLPVIIPKIRISTIIVYVFMITLFELLVLSINKIMHDKNYINEKKIICGILIIIGIIFINFGLQVIFSIKITPNIVNSITNTLSIICLLIPIMGIIIINSSFKILKYNYKKIKSLIIPMYKMIIYLLIGNMIAYVFIKYISEKNIYFTTKYILINLGISVLFIVTLKTIKIYRHIKKVKKV